VKGDYVEQAITERDILQKASHPFVMKLHYSFQNKTTLYLIMDFCPGGELFTHLTNTGNFDEETVRFYTAEIVLGMQYLHEELNVIYRDLKLKNILLDASGHIKITDFGLSKVATKASTICGTANYVAPEILRNEGYDKTVDWWGLGCLVYEMLLGYPAFSSEGTKLEKDIVEIEPMIPSHLSNNVKDLLSKLLAKDPNKRLGFNGAEEIKKHPFFNTLKWDDVLALKKTPPFVPMLTRAIDLRHFNKDIVEEPVVETPVHSGTKVASSWQNPFQNFTYVQKELLPRKHHATKSNLLPVRS